MRYFCFSTILLLATHLKAQEGLTGEYYDGSNFEKKVATRIDEKIDFLWHIPPVFGIKAEKYSVRWKGQITVPESGSYNFTVAVNNASRVWVNNKLIIDCSILNDKFYEGGRITLEKGKTYPIKVEYINFSKEAHICLYWAIPSSNTTYSTSISKIESEYFKQKNQTLAKKDEPKTSKYPLSIKHTASY
jgi:hypothetical protein